MQDMTVAGLTCCLIISTTIKPVEIYWTYNMNLTFTYNFRLKQC